MKFKTDACYAASSKMDLKAIVLFAFLLTVTEGYRSYLYSPDDKLITTLDANTFNREILRKSNAFIVQFYASWCGHCIRFSPHFQQFSKNIVGWRNILQLAVVNCADYTNVGLCTDFGVPGFPTIRFFRPFARKGDLGENVNLHERSVQALVEKTAFLLQNFSLHHTIPLDWPELRPVAKFDFNWISQNQVVLSITENSTSLIGTQVILDLAPFDDYIIVYRAVWEKNDTSSSLTVTRMHKHNQTEVIYTASREQLMDSGELRRNIVMTIRKLYLSQVWPVEQFFAASTQPTTTTIAPKLVKEYEVKPIHVDDLYNALHYALYNEVMLKKRLNTTRIEALHRFLIAIRDHFPFAQSKGGYTFVVELIKFIDSKMAKKVIPGKELREALTAIERENALPPPKQWKSCAGSLSHLRGYPCSLWLLFHTLTVSEHLKYNGDERGQNSSDVLKSITGYVNNFYTCRLCVQHFNRMSVNQNEQLQRFYDSSPVLWLWWAHNQVNERIKGDESEDPAFPKIQFPPRKACAKCHTSNWKWDQKQVLDYMSEHYKASSIQL